MGLREGVVWLVMLLRISLNRLLSGYSEEVGTSLARVGVVLGTQKMD